MLCNTSRKGLFADIENQCIACATKLRIIDSPHGNVYMFMELTLCAMSVGLGYRPEDDYSGLYQHAVSGHCFNPDEVPKQLYDDLKSE